MVLKEAERRGIKVVVASRDIETGADLLADKPFNNDLIEAKKGSIDAYHSGFPCTTYTRLRWNPKEGYPGPVRSKSKPYGLDDLSEKRKKEVDDGTLMMARSVFMGKAIMDFDWDTAFPSVVTLENPPPSDLPEHVSAWEMAELADFVQDYKLKVANFNTCCFQSDRKLGTKNFKPQRFAGNLPGLEGLSRTCQCGKHKHEQIVGKEKSAASAGYPVDLAVEYARLLLDHFEKVLKMEFTEGKLETAAGNLNRLRNLKAQSMYQPAKHGAEKASRTPSEPPLKRLKVKEKLEESKAQEGRSEIDKPPLKRKPQNPKGKSIEERLREGERCEDPEDQVQKTTTAKAKPAAKDKGGESEDTVREGDSEEQVQPGINLAWKGGEGPYGTNKPARGKKHLKGLKVETALGGMRDPHKAVSKLPTVQNLGLKVQAAWDTFLKKHWKALELAQSYGTENCAFDPYIVNEWKAVLRKLFGAKGNPKVTISEKDEYTTPVDVHLFEAWQKRSGDPDCHVIDWLKEGTPLGIERQIPVCGIFPRCEPEQQELQSCKEFDILEWEEELRNYKSLEENKEDARIELDRYKQCGFTSTHPKEFVSNMKAYTISRLGLIVKVKENGVKKRRIILDMRRSGGNQKSTLPEKLVLPRLTDVISMAKEMFHQRPFSGEGNYSQVGAEFALIDIQDAFTTLAVHRDELPHTLAPSTEPDEIIMFRALLFGYKTAPLLYSRFAAFLSRLLQAIVDEAVARHQTYLDDSIWLLQGGLAARNKSLALVLYTAAALGVRIALEKGARKAAVTWVGIELTIDKDCIIVTLPLKFMQELRELLNNWLGKGMAPIKDLRKAAGKAAWMANALPRFRWVTSVLYAVLKDTLHDVASGKEEERRNNRTDKRDKSGLFAVKRLEAASTWAVNFLDCAKERPIRRIHLSREGKQEVRLLTDASPEGLGAILLVNNQVVGALASPIDQKDADMLGFEMGSSSSQGIVEALAILVGLKHWKNRLAHSSLHLVLQSDSITALALSRKLSASSPALNFIGAELGLVLEELAIEQVQPVHIPGVANKVADFLSRPSIWASQRLPKELEGIEIACPSGRNEFYYKLPSPAAMPEFWGSSADGVAAWDALRWGWPLRRTAYKDRRDMQTCRWKRGRESFTWAVWGRFKGLCKFYLAKFD